MPSIYLDMLERLKNKASKVFGLVLRAGFKISNFILWTAKYLMQASWTELALHDNTIYGVPSLGIKNHFDF